MLASGLSAKDAPVGHLVNNRIRPTYAIPVNPRWQTPDFYPRTRLKKLGADAVLRWQILPWSNVDGYAGVQSRGVHAAVFSRGEFACYIAADQVRNNTGNDIDIEDLVSVCYDDSYNLGKHADGFRNTLKHFGYSNYVYPLATSLEFAELLMAPAFKNSNLWAPAIKALIPMLNSWTSYVPVTFLEASPLEFVWYHQQLNKQWSEVGYDTELFTLPLNAENRRRRALQALYRRELAATPVDGAWMGINLMDPH